jgi:glycosyltransferase involved in cell wall biosynthesis
MSLRLVAVATHPVQYQAPFFEALAARPEVDLQVLYAVLPTPEQQGAGFETPFKWDVPLLDGYEWGEIENVRRTDGQGFGALSAPRIRTQLQRERADALLVTGWQSRVLLQAAQAGRRLHLPVLVRGESNDLTPRPWWKRFVHLRLFRRFTHFLAIGKANRRFYVRAGVPEDRIFASPYGVDNARFAAAAETLRPNRNELRRSWNVAGDGCCVLFAGKFQEKKRPFDLLEALELARKSRSDLRLLMVGSGELDTALRERARERRLPVTFAGFLNQTEIPRAYAAADALVLPSDAGETWGLVVNEAMASGLPAIVSDKVGCREDLIEDGVTGFSFPLGAARALAACLTTVAEDPIRASAMGEAAKALVTKSYSIERAVEGTLAALETVSVA